MTGCVISVSTEPKLSASHQQGPNARERRTALQREGRRLRIGKQVGMFTEIGVVLGDIGLERRDPGRNVDCRRPDVGGSDVASKMIGEREVDLSLFGEAIERPGLVEAAHFDRPFHGFAGTVERQPSIGFARDCYHAAIEVRRKRLVRFEFGIASCLALI